jgi:hypothetical protein
MSGARVTDCSNRHPFFESAASGSKLVTDFQIIDRTSSRCLNCGAVVPHGADAAFARSQHRNNPKRGNCCTHPESKAAMRKQEKRDLREQRKKAAEEEAMDGADGEVGEVTQADGVYTGQVKDVIIPHGYGVKKFVDGSSYAGEWHEGKRHGHGVHVWTEKTEYPWLEAMKPNQMQHEGAYSANERSGSGVETTKGSDGWTTVFRGSYDDKGRRRAGTHCSETLYKGSASKKTSKDSGKVLRGLYTYPYSDYPGEYYNYTCGGHIMTDTREDSDEKVEAANQAADESAEKARDCAQKARCVAKAAARAAAALDALRLKQKQEEDSRRVLTGVSSVQLGEIIEIGFTIPPDDDEDELEDDDGGCEGGGDGEEWPIEWESAYVSALRIEEGEVFFDVMLTRWARSTMPLRGPYKASREGHEWRRCSKGMASQSDLNAAFKQTSFIDWFWQMCDDRLIKRQHLQLDWSNKEAAGRDLSSLWGQYRYACYSNVYALCRP